jgi:hypothetical protein
MTLTPEVLLAIVGVNGVLGLLALLGYLYTYVKLQAAGRLKRISVREAIEGQQIFNSEQVIQILREFKTEDAALTRCGNWPKFKINRKTAPTVSTVK